MMEISIKSSFQETQWLVDGKISSRWLMGERQTLIYKDSPKSIANGDFRMKFVSTFSRDERLCCFFKTPWGKIYQNQQGNLKNQQISE